MKRILSILISAAVLLTLFTIAAASAGAQTSGDYEYTVNSDGTASVTGYNGSAAKLTIPSKLDGKTVTTIGANAFEKCALESVTLPNSIQKIDNAAFKDCSKLSSIAIPDSVKTIGERAFTFCSSMKSVTFGKAVQTIGEEAFNYCGSIASINIPASVTSIGASAFGGCDSLTSITVNQSNKIYDSRSNCNAIIETKTNTLIAGCGNTVIPNTVKEIGESAFYSNDGLKKLTIPNSVTKIGSWAFAFCDYLESVTLPNSLITIDSYAFEDCSKLNGVTIPSSVKTIGNEAFYGCRALTSIHIPASVTYIGGQQFSWCSGLTGITVDKNNTVYDSRNNCNALIETQTNTLMSGCVNTVIPNTVKEIAEYAFCNQKSLESIVIPDSVTKIGSGAFYNCSNLKSITIPASVKEMTSYTFRYCDNLTIYGYKGTYAEEFAANNSIPFVALGSNPGVICGDADGDGKVTILDATTIQRHIAELETKSYVKAAADADNDGMVTILDATAIQRHIAELPAYEGIGKKV